jgi:hypothetical protein
MRVFRSSSSGVKYVRRNFISGLQGREPSGLIDLNGQLRWWIAEVANQRVHGTTHEHVWSLGSGSRRDAPGQRRPSISIYG